MAVKSRLFGSVLVMVMAMMIWECMGIISMRDSSTRLRRKSRLVTVCKFGNKNFTIGHKWHPHLEPNGINYCINCRCKKHGLTHCSRVKCKPISCPGKYVPKGKCCSACPVPASGAMSSKKQCRHGGKSYQQGEVWDIPMKSKDAGDNNCAECTCHNGKVSCAIRICPALTCSALMQVRGRDSCCTQCRGFPLTPVGGPKFKPAVSVQGSCFNRGRYYKDKDMWNPVAAAVSLSKAFQQPNCDLCVCQNTAVKCKTPSCPKLKCDNPVRKRPKDCCQTCPDKQVVTPIVNRTLPRQNTPPALNYPDCRFLSKIYKHNSSWSPQIPGHDPNNCVRCTCEFSRVKCSRTGCGVASCGTGKSCSDNKDVKSTPKPKRLCNPGDRVHVYLFVNTNSKRPKAKQNYIARIAIIDPKEKFVKIHFWDVVDNKATIRSSRPRITRFQKRKANYQKLGETKQGRINRFLNKEKTLEKCNRGCKSKAKEFINMLKTRVRYLKTTCTAIDLFRSLKSSPGLP